MKGVALVDSTGQCKIDGKGTQSIIDQDERFHIISPGSTLSAPGRKRNQLSLAHALALQADLRLFSTLKEDKDLKVIFINGSQSVEAKQQTKYDQMTQYREALGLLQTDFTIMSLRSLGFLCFPFQSVPYCEFFVFLV